MVRILLTSMIFLVFGVTEPALAEQSQLGAKELYCGERKLGRYFYCDRQEEQTAPEKPSVIEVKPQPKTAMDELREIQKELEEVKARAVLHPSAENVAAYIRLQRTHLDRAGYFADQWQRVVWQDPSLDYTLLRPVNTLGKRQWLDQRKEEKRELLSRLNERYGVFYVFAASCGACRDFGPVLRAFVDEHGLDVKAISLDGGESIYFPNAVRDTGQLQRLGLSNIATPAVVLFDAVERKVIPVSFGLVSHADLAQRVFLLTQTVPGEDF